MGLFDKLFGKKSSVMEKPPVMPAAAPKAHGVSKPREGRVHISCGNCGGYYVLRDGKYGIFAGCAGYPSCKSTLSLADFVLRYIETYGINIYRWDRTCYKCGQKTSVYSYYLDYDLADLDEWFSMGGPTVGLGDLSCVDELLSRQLPTIQLRYSNTTKSKYMANTCEHCGALQGRNYVVDDPHEIIGELWHDRGMGKFLYQNIRIADTAPLKQVIQRLYAQGE